MTRFWMASIALLLLCGAPASAGQRSDHLGLSFYDRDTGLSLALGTGQHGDYLRVGHDRYVRYDDRRYRGHRHERRYRHYDHHRRHEHHYYRDHHDRYYRNDGHYRDRHYRRGDHYRHGHRHDRYCRH